MGAGSTHVGRLQSGAPLRPSVSDGENATSWSGLGFDVTVLGEWVDLQTWSPQWPLTLPAVFVFFEILLSSTSPVGLCPLGLVTGTVPSGGAWVAPVCLLPLHGSCVALNSHLTSLSPSPLCTGSCRQARGAEWTWAMDPRVCCRSEDPVTMLLLLWSPGLGDDLAWHGVGEGWVPPRWLWEGTWLPSLPAPSDGHCGGVRPGRSRAWGDGLWCPRSW